MDLSTQFEFEPISVETLGPLSESVVDLMTDVVRRITMSSGQSICQ